VQNLVTPPGVFAGPVLVVVVYEDTEDSNGAHEPLGDAVGLGRANRRANDFNPTLEDLVKTLGDFLIAIANRTLRGFRALRQSPRQLPRLLDDLGRLRIRRAPGHVHTPATQLDEESEVESLPARPTRP